MTRNDPLPNFMGCHIYECPYLPDDVLLFMPPDFRTYTAEELARRPCVTIMGRRIPVNSTLLVKSLAAAEASIA